MPYDYVSIHAPVMGAKSALAALPPDSCFNPRTRDGCENARHHAKHIITVSIHAPVMGAKEMVKE